jgi:hypothetical protein
MKHIVKVIKEGYGWANEITTPFQTKPEADSYINKMNDDTEVKSIRYFTEE